MTNRETNSREIGGRTAFSDTSKKCGWLNAPARPAPYGSALEKAMDYGAQLPLAEQERFYKSLKRITRQGKGQLAGWAFSLLASGYVIIANDKLPMNYLMALQQASLPFVMAASVYAGHIVGGWIDDLKNYRNKNERRQ